MHKIFKNLFLLSLVIALSACADLKTAKVASKAGDYETARENWEKLADMGFPEAQTSLGLMYVRGEGVAADPKRGIALLEQAAAKNNPQAMFELGKLYQEGKGVKKDLTRARDLFQRALAQGYDRSLYQLGQIAEEERYYADAEEFYLRSLALPNDKAAVKIGGLYEKSTAQRKADLVKALSWYYFAQNKGVEGLENKIAKAEKKLSRGQIVEARNLSKTHGGASLAKADVSQENSGETVTGKLKSLFRF